MFWIWVTGIAGFFLGILVMFFFGDWKALNKIHRLELSHSLNGLREEIREMFPMTAKEQEDWNANTITCVREAIRSEMGLDKQPAQEPANTDAVLTNCESAMKGLTDEVQQFKNSLRSCLDILSKRVEKLEGAVVGSIQNAIAKQNCDPENPDADTTQTRDEFREMVYAMVQDELRRENLIGFSSFDRNLVGLSKRVEKLEGADVSDFLNVKEFPHHRFRTALEYWQHLEAKIEKIEDRLSPVVAAAVSPPVASFWQEYARKASDAVQEKIPASTLPDDEEVIPGVTRRELNESNAAWKLFGQLLRDARLASGVSVPKTIDHFNAISCETGGLLPFPEMLDALIATYRPDAVLERQIRDAWAIAQKPYLGRVQAAGPKPEFPPPVRISESTGKETGDPIIDLIEQAFAKWDRGEFGDPNFVKTKPVDRLGFVLEKLRHRAGLSAKDAKRIGVSSWERLSQIENFSSVPTDNELSLMLNAYSPPSHLVSRIWRLWGECGQAANQEL